MGIMQRRKGQVGEREIINLLQPVVNAACARAGVAPLYLARNLQATDKGGHDMVGLEWLSLEIKRQEANGVNVWWRQCCEQARLTGAVPVLVYRPNKQKWRARLWGKLCGQHWAVVDVAFEDFLAWFETRLVEELQNGKK